MRYSFFALLLACMLSACGPGKQTALTSDFGDPDALFDKLQVDFKVWWTYHKKYTLLSEEYIALDDKNKSLSEKAFLKKLLSGNYIPIKVYSESKETFFKLYRLEGRADPSIIENVQDEAANEYYRHDWEGKPFPPFHFTDLEGNEYTNKDLLGKIVFIKTWFVACAPCIKEMPALNEMVANFEERDNMVFLSLALNEPKSIKKFLTKRAFDYAIVPESGGFIQQAGIFGDNPAYPTHIVINEEGLVEKTVSTYEELEKFIDYTGL